MSAGLIQAISLGGGALIRVAYGGQQYRGLRGDSLVYGLLNLVGSLMLAASAIAPLNFGVLLLESAWALISLGIVTKAVFMKGR